MVKIDLITGFLGSGKTTFIKKYAQYYMNQGQKIAILENDYGAINIDMMMLKNLEGPLCDLYMVVGGSDYDCHKRRLHSKLITLAMLGYQRVIMEPSGIFDVDEFFDTLQEDPLDHRYEVGSVISIVDANLEKNLSEESDYLLVSQTADAGIIVLSKTQFATEQDMQNTIEQLNGAMEHFHCNRRVSLNQDVLAKDWDELDETDFQRIADAGFLQKAHVKMPVSTENKYDSLFYMNVKLPENEIQQTIEKLMADPAAGEIFRIKGMLHYDQDMSMHCQDADISEHDSIEKNDSGRWIEVNATHQNTEIRSASVGQEVMIVIGENLNQDVIGAYWDFSFGSGRERADEN